MNITDNQNINQGITLGAVGAGVGGVIGAVGQHSNIKEIKKTTKDEFVKYAREVAQEKNLSKLPEYMASKDVFLKYLKANRTKIIGKCAGIGLAAGVALAAVKSIFSNKRNNELLIEQQLMMQNAQMTPSEQMAQQQILQQQALQQQAMQNNQLMQQQTQSPQQVQEITPEQPEALKSPTQQAS